MLVFRIIYMLFTNNNNKKKKKRTTEFVQIEEEEVSFSNSEFPQSNKLLVQKKHLKKNKH